MLLTPRALQGALVWLEPLAEAALPELARAALSAPEIWDYFPYPMQSEADVDRALRLALTLQAAGEALVFATRLAGTGELAGGTSIRALDRGVPSVEIGGTWLLPRWQRTHVNTEAKLLMLGHCFERLGCERVELKTDVRNLRSQAAIARLGATREGVLRAHMRRADGQLRDSVLFSMLAAEWPAARARLAGRLAAGASACSA